MTRAHDMGGRFGDGPVVPEPDGTPVFSEVWHGRALAVTLAAAALGRWNIDMSRHVRECLAPQDYSRLSYYEIWAAGLADLLVATGVLSASDLLGTDSDAPHPLAARALQAGAIAGMLARGAPASRDSAVAPLFEPGQRVRTVRPAGNRLVDGGHTRLPAYAQGATGRILRLNGAHVLPDSNAHGLGEAPEPLYTVAFAAAELWVAPEHPRDQVMLDLWQSYLAAA